MIASATLLQKCLLGIASTGLVGSIGLVLSNTKAIAQQEVRIQATEQMEAKIDKLADQLSVTNANIAALNAHLEDAKHDRQDHKGH